MIDIFNEFSYLSGRQHSDSGIANTNGIRQGQPSRQAFILAGCIWRTGENWLNAKASRVTFRMWPNQWQLAIGPHKMLG